MRILPALRGSLSILAGLLVAVVLAASRGRAGEAHEGHEVLDVPEYRLRLLRPGPRWILLDEAAIRRHIPGSLLGAMDAQGALCSVEVAVPPVEQLEAFVRLRILGLQAESKHLDRVSALTYLDQQAVRYHASLSVRGIDMRLQGTAFLHQGRLYVVEGRVPTAVLRASRSVLVRGLTIGLPGSAPTPETVDPVFEPFHAALDLLPGSVQDRAPAPPTTSTVHGPLWRFKGGVFEDAAARVRVEVPRGWTFLPESDAQHITPLARMGMTHAATGTIVTLVSEAVGGVDSGTLTQLVAEQVSAGVQQRPVGLRTATFLGEELEWVRILVPGEFPVEICLVVRVLGDRAIQARVMLPQAHLPAAWSVAQHALAGVFTVPEAKARALRAELERLPDSEGYVEAQASYRGGVWRDFERGLLWERPSGSWRILPPGGYRPYPDTVFAALDLETGVMLSVLAPAAPGGDFASRDPERRHAAVVNLIAFPEGTRDAPSPRRLGELDTLWSLSREWAPAPFRLAVRRGIASGRWRDKLFVAVAHGVGADAQSTDAAIEAGIGALSFHAVDLRMQDNDAQHIEDRRLGLALRAPGEHWVVRDETPESARNVASVLTAAGGGQRVVALAVYAPRATEALSFLMVEMIQSTLGVTFPELHATEVSEGELAGAPALLRRWRIGAVSAELLVTTRGNIVYGLAVDSREDGAGLKVQQVAAGFSILP